MCYPVHSQAVSAAHTSTPRLGPAGKRDGPLGSPPADLIPAIKGRAVGALDGRPRQTPEGTE